MTSQHWAKTSKFWKNGFIKEQFTWKIPFTFDYQRPINIGVKISHFWNDDVTTGGQNFQKSQKKSEFWDSNFKNNATPQFFTLPLPFIFQVWTLFDPILGKWHKIAIFWEAGHRNRNSPPFKTPSNIDFDLFITLDTWFTTFGTFLHDLKIMTSQKKYIFQNFEKLTKKLKN